jgi:hypothetical protein
MGKIITSLNQAKIVLTKIDGRNVILIHDIPRNEGIVVTPEEKVEMLLILIYQFVNEGYTISMVIDQPETKLNLKMQ